MRGPLSSYYRFDQELALSEAEWGKARAEESG